MPYRMGGPFNGYKLTEDFSRFNRLASGVDPRLRTCPACGAFLNKWDVDFDLAEKPQGGPMLSMTVDGFYIASPSFKARYEAEGWRGLTFRPLSCGYHEVRPTRAVRTLTPIVSDARFGPALRAAGGLSIISLFNPICADCGRAKHYGHAGDWVLAAGETIDPTEIVGVDHLVGPGRYPWDNFLAGDAIAASHKAKKMGGVNCNAYHPVHNVETLPPDRLAKLLAQFD